MCLAACGPRTAIFTQGKRSYALYLLYVLALKTYLSHGFGIPVLSTDISNVLHRSCGKWCHCNISKTIIQAKIMNLWQTGAAFQSRKIKILTSRLRCCFMYGGSLIFYYQLWNVACFHFHQNQGWVNSIDYLFGHQVINIGQSRWSHTEQTEDASWGFRGKY